MEIITPETPRERGGDKIHISDLAYHECDRFLYLLYSGQYVPVHDQQTLWHFAVGKKFHELIQENFKNTMTLKDEMRYFVFNEVKVEYEHLTGRLDMLVLDAVEMTADVIDIKTTNQHIVDRAPTPAMQRQVMTYAGILAEQGGFEGENGWFSLEGYSLRCWIWKINKSGLPRYFDWDSDRWAVNGDICEELARAEERALGLVKCLKTGKSPQKRPILCAGCAARAVCDGNVGKLEL